MSKLALRRIIFWVGVVLLTISGEFWMVPIASGLAYGMEAFFDAAKFIALVTALPIILGMVFVRVGGNYK